MGRKIFERFGHHCDLPPEEKDECERYINSANPILNFIRKSILIAPDSSTWHLNFGSQVSISSEGPSSFIRIAILIPEIHCE